MLLFPIFLFVICLLIITLFATESAVPLSQRINEALVLNKQIFLFLGPIIVIRGLITFFFQKQIMFGFSGAKELTRKDNPEIYNIVENLCISRGLPMPKI
jgi:heat shock protein HtpX